MRLDRFGPSPLWRFAQMSDVEEGGAFEADVDERGLHARQHPTTLPG